MGRVGMIAAASLAMMATVGMMPAPQVIETRATTVVSQPAQQQQQRAVTGQALSARDEVERVDELSAVFRRHRRVWDGKNRTPGDRAHKRWKRARAAGRR